MMEFAVRGSFEASQADVIRIDIVRPEVDETTALGAAYAAGLAVGYRNDLEELRENWCVDRELTAEIPTPM